LAGKSARSCPSISSSAWSGVCSSARNTWRIFLGLRETYQGSTAPSCSRISSQSSRRRALYNPRSKGRDWQLERAQQLLLSGRPENTPVVLARQLGRPEEKVSLHALGSLPIEEVDMLTLVLVGNSSSRAESGRMVTPRGYPGAELQ